MARLLDNQRFARGVSPDRKQLQVAMVRRLKQEMVGWDGAPMFPVRMLESIGVDYQAAERQAHSALKEYTQLRVKGSQDKCDFVPPIHCAPTTHFIKIQPLLCMVQLVMPVYLAQKLPVSAAIS